VQQFLTCKASNVNKPLQVFYTCMVQSEIYICSCYYTAYAIKEKNIA